MVLSRPGNGHAIFRGGDEIERPRENPHECELSVLNLCEWSKESERLAASSRVANASNSGSRAHLTRTLTRTAGTKQIPSLKSACTVPLKAKPMSIVSQPHKRIIIAPLPSPASAKPLPNQVLSV